MQKSKREKYEEKIMDDNAKKNPPRSIADIIENLKKRGVQPGANIPRYDAPVRIERPAPLPPPPKRFVLTCWDGDIYILTGFETADEVQEKIGGLDWVRMPNGSRIKASSIAKIQSWEDYQFQYDQKSRHKRGQYIAGRDANRWYHNIEGYIGEADTKAIMLPPADPGAPQLEQSTVKKLTDGGEKR